MRTVARQGFGYRRQVRKQRRARCGGHGNRAQLSCADVGQRGCDAVEHHLHPSAHQVEQRGCAAAVGNMGHVDASHALEQFRFEMGNGTAALRCDVQTAVLLLRERNQFGNRLRRQIFIDQQNVRHIGDQRNGDKILHEVVAKLRVERGGNGIDRGWSHQQGVAVGRGMRGDFGTDVRPGARPVVDHHRLAQPLAELLAHEPCQQVRRAGGRKRHDHLHRLFRIIGVSPLRDAP